jgi:hypothetical protein
MPVATPNPDLEKYYLDKLRAKVSNPRDNQIHASDLDLCPIKVIYRRRNPDTQLSDKAILFFTSGLAVEAFIGCNHKQGEKDGVLCSADDAALGALTEIKSTRKGTNKFDPITSCPWWIFRCMTYRIVFNEPISLAVFFWVGNRKDVGIDFKAWSLDFTNQELAAHWKEVLRRRDIVKGALERGADIPREVSWHCQYWDECRECEFKSICYIVHGENIGQP